VQSFITDILTPPLSRNKVLNVLHTLPISPQISRKKGVFLRLHEQSLHVTCLWASFFFIFIVTLCSIGFQIESSALISWALPFKRFLSLCCITLQIKLPWLFPVRYHDSFLSLCCIKLKIKYSALTITNIIVHNGWQWKLNTDTSNIQKNCQHNIYATLILGIHRPTLPDCD
jgi:hypothetical protein